MAGESTVTTSAGLYKEVYGGENDIDKVVPVSSVLYDIFPFSEDERIGDSFHQAVTSGFEQGFTYGGSSGAIVTLNDQVAASDLDATVTSVELIGKSRMAYTAASRASGSKASFRKAWNHRLLNLRRASMKRLELMLTRGQKGLGIVSGISTGVITITEASWSPMTWAGMEGAILEAFTTSDATATQHDTDLTISAVSKSARTITVTGTSSSVAPADVLFFKGAKTTTSWKECAGLVKVASNTGSLFGIDASSYNLFAGNTASSFGTPTMGKYLAALTEAVDSGLDEKVFLGIPPKAWEVCNADLAEKRDYDGSYSKAKAENGSQSISFYGQSGEVELRSMPYLWRGESVIFPKSPYSRKGSAEMGMGVPGLPGDGREVFFHVQTQNAVETRSYTDQALFCVSPNTSCYVSGITYP